METAYIPDPTRYDHATFRRCGNSGLVLPAITLGLWQNFGGADVFETGRAMIRRAFDRGVTHFDLANNYGPPYGSAEENFGAILRKDFGLRKDSRGLRNELVISTKAGWDMWPGPYGIGGSRKYLLASLDDSLKRMGLDYVDIFYAHRPWKDCPLEETMGALVSAVHQGKALYVGISSYSPAKILKQMGVPLLIHQPSYSMLNRWIEKGLLATLDELGVGCIAFSALAQGLLTSKYLKGIPKDSRAKLGNSSLLKEFLSEENIKRVRALNDIAQARGQTLAQMAIAWVLRDQRVTSALIGARNVEQLDDSLDALKKLKFTAAELKEIDRYARDSELDLWREAREQMT
jgi:L-glyceraldehyde 3-phosphate reductase